MTTLNEQLPHDAGFIVSESNGSLSRDAITVFLNAAATVKAGTVMGKRDDGTYQQLDTASSEGNSTAVGILVNEVDSRSANAAGVLINKDAEVRDDDLIWPTGISAGNKATAIAALLALGIKIRAVGTSVTIQTT